VGFTKWSAATSLVVLALGCGGGTGPDTELAANELAGPTEITLRHGQEAVVAGTALRVAFVRVSEDSRCPIDVICVWQGNAAVEVRLRVGDGAPSSLELNTALEPMASERDGVRVTLLEVQPAPRAATPTEAKDYSIRLRLESIR
jgi:hypothetical protein